jgi:glycosyltransferase involved in cell wall biosynthesis
MHVLWVNDHAAFQGGAERYVHGTAALLAGRGFQSSLFFDVSTPLDPAFARPFGRGTFPMVDLPQQIASLEPDLIYVHRLGDRQRLRQLKASGVPVVRFFHDHQLFCLREHKYTGFGQRTCTRSVGLHCYACPGFLHRRPDRSLHVRTLRSLRSEHADNRRLDAFVVGSTYMADQVADHGFARERITVLPLFGEMPAPQVPAVDRERDLLLFVGQVVRGKGLDVLLRALAATRHTARLAVAGGGAQLAQAKALASDLGLDARVTFHGSLDPSRLEELYARAVALVVPSRSPETFGLVGLEAMQRGLPVIASRVGGMGEWLREGETGLGFPSGDAGALARWIDWLLDHPEAGARMGRAGRALVEERFTPDRHLDGLVGLFDNVSKGRLQ